MEIKRKSMARFRFLLTWFFRTIKRSKESRSIQILGRTRRVSDQSVKRFNPTEKRSNPVINRKITLIYWQF